MFVLYEEDGDFRVGNVMQEAAGTLQVEAPHGKRSKIKATHVLLQFRDPEFGQLLPKAQALQAEFDAAFLWECAPQQEFDFLSFGEEYFGAKPDAVQSAALLFALHAAPLYFHRKGRGKYKPAPPEILKAALAAAEKKRIAAEQQSAWADALVAGQMPTEIARVAAHLLAKPDKNSAEYKALALACERASARAEHVLMKTGVFASEHEMHRRVFEVLQFPRGTGFPEVAVAAPHTLPLADVQAFSIDDITTTEIDDAFSVTFLEGGMARIGIHIAAPALLCERGDALDQIARDRLSTVYMPGDKITMLPDALVELSTLAQGREVAALSLYVEARIEDGTLTGEMESKIERITIAHNFRHNLLDEKVTPQALDAIDLNDPHPAADFLCARELALLWKVRGVLSEQRDIYRGKTENNHRIDYNFYVVDGRVEILPRRRDAPLDLLVAEFMILVNQTWGGLLHEKEVPGIYRTQPPGARVRMATHAAPHVGLGVPQYAWSTSPLRRYVDLVNQWQLISVLKNAPPVFAANDADLFAAVSAFDTTYKAYADFQSNMERYWCLRWLEQRDISQAMAVVIRDDIVRFQDIPLIVRLPGFSGQPRGTVLKLQVMELDFVGVDIHCKLIEVCEQVEVAMELEAEEVADEVANGVPTQETPAEVSTDVVLEIKDGNAGDGTTASVG
ncbi:MAG: RNB domain-containing ribonuclease [Burkholderiales bacterium]|nr:RNB domain-containing ribonuclease [Burkholderiales bacterium]